MQAELAGQMVDGDSLHTGLQSPSPRELPFGLYSPRAETSSSPYKGRHQSENPQRSPDLLLGRPNFPSEALTSEADLCIQPLYSARDSQESHTDPLCSL